MKPKGQKILYYIGISVGILGGLIGVAFAIAASPILGSIFSLFFIVVFGYLFGGQYLRSRKRNKLLATGLQADGKILDMWDTGVTINNQPQIGMKIEVTPPTGAPFTSEITLVISRLQTAYYQVGVSCIVRYDPNNKKTVAIESLGGTLSSQTSTSGFYGSNENQEKVTMPPLDSLNRFFPGKTQTEIEKMVKDLDGGTIGFQSSVEQSSTQGSSFFPGKTPEEIEETMKEIDIESKRVVSVGTECKAIIKSCQFTNIYVAEGYPFNFFELVVMPDNKPAYEATCYGVISTASTSKFQPGKQIWVKYDPEDKKKVSLSHSKIIVIYMPVRSKIRLDVCFYRQTTNSYMSTVRFNLCFSIVPLLVITVLHSRML